MKKASLTAASLFLISFLTGCASGARAETLSVKGGYKEEEVIFPYNSYVYANMSPLFDIGGEPFFFEAETDMFYSFDPEVKVVEREGKRLLAESEKTEESGSHSSSSDQIVNVITACDSAVLYTCWDKERTCYEFRTESGDVNRIDTNALYYAGFSADGRLFIADQSGVSEVSLSNGKLTPLMSAMPSAGMGVVNDLIIAVTQDDTYIYDIKEGKEKSVPKYLSEFFKGRIDETTVYNSFQMCEGDNGSVYVCCEDGIFRFMPDGNQMEQIIDGVVNTIGSPAFHPASVFRCENGTIVVSSETGKILKYTYDPDMVSEITSELKIYSIDKNDTLSQIISDYASANRNVKVSYQYGRRNGISYSDAMKEFTTRMLAGDAPDIIMIDGMDIQNLKERDLLCDLGQYKDEWMPEEGLYENTALWNRTDDKLYSVSCKFRVPAVAADKKKIGSIKSFHDIAEEVKRIRKENDPTYSILNIWDTDAYVRLGMIYEGNDLLKDLSKEKLTSFISDCETMSKNDVDRQNGMTIGFPQFTPLPNEYSFTQTYYSYLSDKNGLAAGTVNGFDNEYNILLSSYDVRKSGIEYRLGLDESRHTFIPVCSLAVTEAGKNREEAIRFLSSALNADSQKMENYDGFPVNNGAYEYFFKLYRSHNVDTEYYGIYSRSSEHAEDFFEERWPNTNENAKLTKYLKTLDEPVVPDCVTISMIEEAFEKCDTGSMTPEQAAESVLGQLDLKMKE